MPRLDVFYAEVSPMDKHGYFSFGMSGAEIPAMPERASMILLEVNKKMPRTFGNNLIHISEVTAVCESDRPLSELQNPPLSENDKKNRWYDSRISTRWSNITVRYRWYT